MSKRKKVNWSVRWTIVARTDDWYTCAFIYEIAIYIYLLIKLYENIAVNKIYML